MKTFSFHHSTFAATLLLGGTLLAGTSDKKAVTPASPLDEGWQFTLALPAWIAGVDGDAGLNGHIANVDVSPDAVIHHIDMAVDVRAEARKGRFIVMGELLYLSLSDGVGSNTVVKKLDARVDETMGDLGFGWRIIEGPRGYVDVIGGVRYMNIYQKLTLQSNDERIDDVSGKLARAGTVARGAIAKRLVALAGKDPTVPIAPIAGDRRERAVNAIARIKSNAADRKARISDALTDALNTTVSRTDDWWDPYIGLRARYNLNQKFYLNAKGDIGGFGVGSDLSWTAEGALGVHLTKNVFAEVGYRALGVDYEGDGFVMDTITHGAQVTLGVNF